MIHDGGQRRGLKRVVGDMTRRMTRRFLPGGSFTGIVLLLIIGLSACADAGAGARLGPQASPTATPGQKPVLPGQSFWKDGASSLLFGTNDSDEYFPNNLQTQPIFQQQLRAADTTLIRTFIEDHTSDAQIDQRITTIQNIGAQCLVDIPSIHDQAYYEHVVSYIGDRCLMYDFGNEPDWAGMSVETYSNAWITQIPALRKINPHALFFVPVISYPHTDFLKQFLVMAKAANVLPDAISIHWYACYQDTQAVCLPRANLLYPAIQDVRADIEQALGFDLPIGVDEWNFDPSGHSPAYGNQTEFVAPFYAAVFAQLVKAHVAYACQFDAASYSAYGGLDMFDVQTNQPKPQYVEFARQIALYKPAK